MTKPEKVACQNPKEICAQNRKSSLTKHTEPVRLTVVGPDPDSRPCPGARLVEREVVRDGRTVWVEEWRVTVSSVGELLELQSGLGAPVLLEGGRLTVMAEGA